MAVMGSCYWKRLRWRACSARMDDDLTTRRQAKHSSAEGVYITLEQYRCRSHTKRILSTSLPLPGHDSSCHIAWSRKTGGSAEQRKEQRRVLCSIGASAGWQVGIRESGRSISALARVCVSYGPRQVVAVVRRKPGAQKLGGAYGT